MAGSVFMCIGAVYVCARVCVPIGSTSCSWEHGAPSTSSKLLGCWIQQHKTGFVLIFLVQNPCLFVHLLSSIQVILKPVINFYVHLQSMLNAFCSVVSGNHNEAKSQIQVNSEQQKWP